MIDRSLDTFIRRISRLNEDKNHCIFLSEYYDITTKDIRAENAAEAERIQDEIIALILGQAKKLEETGR